MDLITFAIDNSQVYAVRAQSYCKRITVQEDYDSSSPPTCDLRQYKVTSGTLQGQTPAYGATPGKVAKGTPMIFTQPGGYIPGQLAGGIATASLSCTVQQVESVQI